MISWAKSNFKRMIPNGLSIFRGVLGILLPFLILHGHARAIWFAFGIFIVGVVTDYLDGFLARRYGIVSGFGKFVDPFMDKILILAPLCAFAKIGFYSMWWVVPVIVREILVTYFRVGWLLEGRAIGAENLGKLKLGMQVSTVAFAFFYQFGLMYAASEGTLSILSSLMMFTLIISAMLTIVSGLALCINNRVLFQSQAFSKYLASLGVGLFPWAPGTWGSLIGLLLAFMTHWNTILYFAVFATLVITGAYAIRRLSFEKHEDPRYVVIDEACGMMMTLALASVNWETYLLGFVLFRIFDVVKPFPIRHVEKLPGWWGILMDDLCAAFYARIILYVAVVCL
ncbi:MAG: CDP-diacylglycerol--glycerol-3-phosphate 3-phosphatidyltransferase [Candidatus Omnitrophica bacterium]|nr:CDP-diacylglycerol--glycerol-3-phosphate 3-phosphatidyltransferase [Candidatus Omnitrophota bacterium]MDD5670969.1 CDP-diacylglycerol--glycerol-3-phosphate 3-phosphatidyltransferase [Candidatus Omnitrophota bacterium]